ncbi:NAD-dependent epimerase/dehydratase family protein [Candidatus Beckwithbacteria bacterium]|nr:NAD-dependent epimerase/dehydratase family protein [Candidatus Beckwithbacteria bacterium]
MASKTLLITGGAGFIGSSLIAKIIDQYQIVCVDNFNSYYNPSWKEDNVKPFLTHPNFRLYKSNIVNLEDLRQIFKNHHFDKIVHLAARAGVRPSIAQPLLYEKVNVQGTLNLLELAKEYKIPHFIFASSSSVYGNQNKVPFSETDPVNEPISPYAATKKAGEMLCYTYAHLYKIKTTCLRFFTVYGPKGRPDMAPYLFTKAILSGEPITKFGDGKSKRDYTYIDDIVAGVIKTIEQQFDFEIFNLGNNQPVELNEFIKTIEEVTGKILETVDLPMQAGDVTQTYANIEKAKKLLAWEPKTSLKEGLTKFVNWYQQARN